MKALLRVYLFSYLLQTIVSFDCPNGGFQIPNEDICVYSVTNAKSYSQAKSECQSLGGIPSKIQNIFENAFIFSSITTDFVYIGVELGSDNKFVYSDGTPLVYQNWASNQPDKTKPCTAMDPQTGKWTSVDCESIRPYTCTSNGAYKL
ncbi:unnamed protein product, partial [Mesorhabditis belari]|uniref:C-type lectin domain-containing protein n=1 Tax=Mesorhabditis belari TaxID=2138241 RepID=A0AAF3JAA1_9BILA